MLRVEGWVDRATALLDVDDHEWRMPRGWTIALVATAVVVAALPIVSLPFRELYRELLAEDGPIEWLQFVCLALTVPVYAWLAVQLARRGPVWLAALYILAAVAVVFIAGEEISWGQRIFGWATPEQLAALNKQGETNIHNVGIMLRIFNAMMLAIASLAVVLPLLRWTVWRGSVRSLAAFGLIPPIALLPAFAFAAIYRLVRFIVLPTAGLTITKYQEATELTLYFGLLAFALLFARAVRLAPQPSLAPGGALAGTTQPPAAVTAQGVALSGAGEPSEGRTPPAP